MSVLDLLLPDRRGIIPAGDSADYSAHPRGHAAGRAQARGGARRAPGPLARRKPTLQALQAASKIVADEMAADPNLAARRGVFQRHQGQGHSRAPGRRRQNRACARQPPASRLYHLALWRRLARIHCALDCATPTARSPAPSRSRAGLLPTSRERQTWPATPMFTRPSFARPMPRLPSASWRCETHGKPESPLPSKPGATAAPSPRRPRRFRD